MRCLTNALIFFILSSFSVCLKAQSGKIKIQEIEDFFLQSSHVISQKGEELSSALFQPDVYWLPVKVPSTVLTGLVANKIYPDPYLGLNNMLIPDASDEFNREYNLEQYSHLPGLSNPWKTLTVEAGCPPEALGEGDPVLKIEGWNVKEHIYKL